jgi:hypothetical protein
MKAGSAEKRTDDDPEIAPGHGVFVHEAKFQAFLKEHKDLVDVFYSLF